MSMTAIRMAQYGTKHGHAAGKLVAMLANPDVEVAGVYEPDAARRAAVAEEAPYRDVPWFDDKAQMLDDPSIVAIASEGLNSESLLQTEEIVDAGKHVWYDKPAGDNWADYQRMMGKVKEKGVYLQMGYMFRYQVAFRQVAEWAKSGLLGDIFSVRAHMSTWLNQAQREVISEHHGGIFFDLAGHMLDQVCWLLGRPHKVTSFLRNDNGMVPTFQDNTLGVFEFDKALAFVDIAAMETRPMARRFEVYGTKGSAIILEGFDPSETVRLCLEEASGGYAKGVTLITVPEQQRQAMYDREIEAFVRVLRKEQAPDRPFEHEMIVQETLLRATGGIPA
jgi:predicted dehydrogenase